MARVTIEEVASEAGVSVATVSRALRGLPNVSPRTRQRVVEAATRMNYRPDPNAARLAAGRTRTIAVGVVAIPIWYTGQVLAGIEAVLTGGGYDLMLFLFADEQVRVRAFGDVGGGVSKRADGAIIVDLQPSAHEVALLEQQAVPWVTVGTEWPNMDSVIIDNADAARSGVEHLVGLGHSRIGLISGGPHDIPGSSSVVRRDGFLTALADAGIPFDRRLERGGEFSALGGYEAMQELLGSPDRPTAVFALSDDMAMGAMRACVEAGVRVPDDMSIVGFDDVDTAFAAGLTTIRQDPTELGAVAARLMLERLDGSDDDPHRVVIPTTLIERSSTAPPCGEIPGNRLPGRETAP